MAHAFNADMVYSGEDTRRAQQRSKQQRNASMRASAAAEGVYARSARGRVPQTSASQAFSPIQRAGQRGGFRPNTTAALHPDSIFQKQYSHAEAISRAGNGTVRPEMMRLALAQKVARGEVHSDVARAYEASGFSGPKATTPAAAFAGARAAPAARSGGLLQSKDRPAPRRCKSALGRRPRVHPGAGLTGSAMRTDPTAESYVLGGESALDYRAAPPTKTKRGRRTKLAQATGGQSALSTSAMLLSAGLSKQGGSQGLKGISFGADSDSSDDEGAGGDFWDAVQATGVAPTAGAARFATGSFTPHPDGNVPGPLSVDDRELAMRDRAARRSQNAYMRTTLLPVVAQNSIAAQHDDGIQRRIRTQRAKVLEARAANQRKQARRRVYHHHKAHDARSVNMPEYSR